MRPLDWACGHFACTAQPNRACVNEDNTLFRVNGEPGFHAERIFAATIDEGHDDGVEPTIEQFGLAVEESQLV